MYLNYFGLERPPFKITPDTEFFFAGANRGPTLDALIYAIGNGEGIVKVVGEVGSGKTLLCRMLEKRLPASTEIIYLANPSLAPEEVIDAIAGDLHLLPTPPGSRQRTLALLQTYLVERHAEGKRVVVFIEEAQAMALGALEQIRLLSNLETAHDKLLQMVLFGQPELDEHLQEGSIRQLRERITHSFHLGGLNRQETAAYIDFRLRAAGYRGTAIFSPAAIRSIHRAARGLIRRTNILADKSLLAAYAGQRQRVTTRDVRAARADSEFSQSKKPRWARLFIATCALATAAVAVFWTQGYPTRSESPAAKPTSASSALAFASPAESAALGPEIDPPNPAPPATEQAQQAPSVASTGDDGTTAVAATGVGEPTTADAAQIGAESVVGTPAAPPTPLPDAPATSEVTTPRTRYPTIATRLMETKTWLNAAPGGTHSVQMMAVDISGKAALEKFLNDLPPADLASIWVYRLRNEGRRGFAVLYGAYENKTEAAQAAQSLVQRHRVSAPYMRTVGGLRRELKMDAGTDTSTSGNPPRGNAE